VLIQWRFFVAKFVDTEPELLGVIWRCNGGLVVWDTVYIHCWHWHRR